MHFPRTICVSQLDIQQQCRKVAAEVAEVLEELTIPPVDLRNVAIELYDAIQAAETGLLILAEQHGLDLNDLRDHVEAKNRSRGYYQ